MTGSQQVLEKEFSLLYDFLSNELPKHFNKQVGMGDFCVNPNIDDEPFSSLLMNFDQFTDIVPAAIKRFLTTLNFDWLIIVSFNIKNPISEDGFVTRSPAFSVNKNGANGALDMKKLVAEWGDRLVSAKSKE